MGSLFLQCMPTTGTVFFYPGTLAMSGLKPSQHRVQFDECIETAQHREKDENQRKPLSLLLLITLSCQEKLMLLYRPSMRATRFCELFHLRIQEW